MTESISWQEMKLATLNQCKTVLRQVKIHEHIHKDNGTVVLWHQEAAAANLNLLTKSLAAGFVDLFFKSVYISSKKVDDTQFEIPSK